jgi:hypothetical protein
VKSKVRELSIERTAARDEVDAIDVKESHDVEN